MQKESIVRGGMVIIIMMLVVVLGFNSSSRAAGNSVRTVGILVNNVGSEEMTKKIYAALTKNLKKINNIQLVTDPKAARYYIVVAPLVTKKMNAAINVNMMAVGYSIVDFNDKSAAANTIFEEVPLVDNVTSSITKHFQQVLNQK